MAPNFAYGYGAESVDLTVDVETGAVLNRPEIVTRGWVYEAEAEDVILKPFHFEVLIARVASASM